MLNPFGDEILTRQAIAKASRHSSLVREEVLELVGFIFARVLVDSSPIPALFYADLSRLCACLQVSTSCGMLF